MACKGVCQVCYRPFTRRMKRLSLPCVCQVCSSCLTDWVLTCVKTQATIHCQTPTHKTVLTSTKLKQLLSKEAYQTYRADFDPNPLPTREHGMWVRYVEDLRVWLVKEMTTESCPYCDSLIEKNGGCSHMVCSRCSRQFCWTCKLTYNVHNEDACTSHSLIVGFWWLIAAGITVLRLSPMIPSQLLVGVATYSVAAMCMGVLLGMIVGGITVTLALVESDIRLPVSLLLAMVLDLGLLAGMWLLWQALGVDICTILTQFVALSVFCSFSFLYLTFSFLPKQSLSTLD